MYATSKKNYVTKRIYKVNQNFYYRRKINQKCYRISLKTKILKIALQRKKIFELMGDTDFMYSLKTGDYELIFEYETIQELEQQLALTKRFQNDLSLEQYEKVNNTINLQKELPKPPFLTFAMLELKFIAGVKKELEETQKKIGKSSYKAYANTFSKLKKYFGDKDIKYINSDEFREYRKYLINKLKLNNKTINIQMIYLSKFLDFALAQKIIDTNEAKGIKQLEEQDLEKENFTKEDFENIKNHNYDKYYENIFEILKYSGMRISELWNITKEDIRKNEDDIYYFQINHAKTKSGNRQIPIHKAILDMVLSLNFPISNKTSNAFNKEVLKQLYLVIDKNSTKSIHTFRANFISKCINNFHGSIDLIQTITGHSLGDSKSLTIKTYAKSFDLKLKKEVVDSVFY